MRKYDLLRSKIEAMHGSVTEHEEAAKYEKMSYHVVKTDPQYKLYALYRKADGRQMFAGSVVKIRSYLRLRRIPDSDVYFG
jgi:hypothetical protein